MNLHMHARGCEKMKIEIEIKEEDWIPIDTNANIQVLRIGDMDLGLSNEVLGKLLAEKYGVFETYDGEIETKDENGYFYGCNHVAIVCDEVVADVAFRTKDPVMYRMFKLYSLYINGILEKGKSRR